MSSPRKFDHELARDMYADGVGIQDLARFFNVTAMSMQYCVDPRFRANQQRLQRERRQRKAAVSRNQR